jgi:hypothetical protein
MFVYLGFDDTDMPDSATGTGRLVREFAAHLPEGCTLWGVVRHQLPRLEGIAYTSNNSSACAMVVAPGGADALRLLREAASAYLLSRASDGSDPGLCVAAEHAVSPELVDFATTATGRTRTQRQAMDAARGACLDGLGGSNDGIIGAAAAVGLTRHGWCGRFIEYGGLRGLTPPLRIRDLHETGIRVVSVDRDPAVPLPDDALAADTGGCWIRPSLWGGAPVLQVAQQAPGVWRTAHAKRNKARTAA